MCHKIRCDGESWKLFGFQGELNKAQESKALFSSPRKPKFFQDSPSHQILEHMHKAIDIDENKN